MFSAIPLKTDLLWNNWLPQSLLSFTPSFVASRYCQNIAMRSALANA